MTGTAFYVIADIHQSTWQHSSLGRPKRPNNMTTEDYKRLLSAHDWQYQKAETASERERGSRQREFLLMESQYSAEWQRLYLAERYRMEGF